MTHVCKVYNYGIMDDKFCASNNGILYIYLSNRVMLIATNALTAIYKEKSISNYVIFFNHFKPFGLLDGYSISFIMEKLNEGLS
jgi:hypothetical protein